MCVRAKLLQSCLIFCDPMDCSWPGRLQSVACTAYSLSMGFSKNTGVGCHALLHLVTWKMLSLFWFSSCPSDLSFCLLVWMLLHQLLHIGEPLHSPLSLTSLCVLWQSHPSKVSGTIYIIMASKISSRDEFITSFKFPDPYRTRHTQNISGQYCVVRE